MLRMAKNLVCGPGTLSSGSLLIVAIFNSLRMREIKKSSRKIRNCKKGEKTLNPKETSKNAG